jgi:hypothetical protein
LGSHRKTSRTTSSDILLFHTRQRESMLRNFIAGKVKKTFPGQYSTGTVKNENRANILVIELCHTVQLRILGSGIKNYDPDLTLELPSLSFISFYQCFWNCNTSN